MNTSYKSKESVASDKLSGISSQGCVANVHKSQKGRTAVLILSAVVLIAELSLCCIAVHKRKTIAEDASEQLIPSAEAVSDINVPNEQNLISQFGSAADEEKSDSDTSEESITSTVSDNPSPVIEEQSQPVVISEDYDIASALGCEISSRKVLDSGYTDVYFTDFGNYHVIFPKEVNSETSLYIFGNCPDIAQWYAEQHNIISVIVFTKLENMLELKVSDMVIKLEEAFNVEAELWIGFSASGRTLMDAAAHYIQKNLEAPRQTLVLVDMALDHYSNFLCINDACCTDDEHMESFIQNNSRFILVAKNKRIVNIDGVKKLIDSCDTTCIRSPYVTHASTLGHPDGIIWKAIENGIIEWATGDTEFFDERYEVFYPEA